MVLLSKAVLPISSQELHQRLNIRPCFVVATPVMNFSTLLVVLNCKHISPQVPKYLSEAWSSNHYEDLGSMTISS